MRAACSKELLSRAGRACDLTVESLYLVDNSGNLNSFDLRVASKESADSLMKVKGQLKGSKMEIVSRGPVAGPESEPVVRLRAAERGSRRAGADGQASGAARWPAVGIEGDQPVFRPSRVGSGRGGATGPHSLGRQPGDHLRGGAPNVAVLDEDLGAHRRGDLAAGDSVSVREAGARAPGRNGGHRPIPSTPKPGMAGK